MLNDLAQFAASMAGRIFAVLLAGIVGAALIASLLSGLQRQRERTADRDDHLFRDVAEALANPAPGPPLPADRPLVVDRTLTADLRTRFPALRAATVYVSPGACHGPSPGPLPGPDRPPAPRHRPPDAGPGCLLVRLPAADGTPTAVTVKAPPLPRAIEPLLTPVYLAALAVAALALALVVARMAARPVARLGNAAATLARDLDAPPMAASGPRDVRLAVAAFNGMQADLQRTVEERTHMLAAISHDLRTPLTRLRLRVDAVTDPVLRERMLADVAAMRELIEDGLELARVAHRPDAVEAVDIAALVQSIVDDAADGGQPVTVDRITPIVMRTRAAALRRIVVNLIDNAVRYAGDAVVSLVTQGDVVRLVVADRGPGIDPARLDTVFEPFYRIDEARGAAGGSGLGLTIARLLARQIDGTVALTNRAGGGLLAELRIPNRATDRPAPAGWRGAHNA